MKDFGSHAISNAESICTAAGATVPLPRNEMENDDYSSAFRTLNADKVPLGINDVTTEGEWRDFNGNEIEYTNWNAGEPNNNGGNEDYVVMYVAGGNGKWKDCGGGTCGGIDIICETVNGSSIEFFNSSGLF